jgi:hypothetical protein
VLEQVDLQVRVWIPLTELVITGTQDSANKNIHYHHNLVGANICFINGQLLTYNNDYSISGTINIYI